nr:vacuolar protein sorting-associated protein 9b [Quercus suber]
MGDTQRRVASDARPTPLHTSRSFTRMDASPSPESPRKRASTLQDVSIPAVPVARRIDTSQELAGKRPMTDVFENNEDEDHGPSGAQTPNPELKLPSTFDELPIEIRSLTERFLESLSAKVHPTPLSAETLSDMFQDFYEKAGSHIATHIANLSSRIGREKRSPNGSRAPVKGRSRAGSGASRGESPAGGEMLTPSEVASRRKARRLLELRRLALEDGVERVVCEKVYDRIWRHRSTDDDARDEKLRSRTAALSVVGIGLKELHMDSDPAKEGVRKTAEEKETEIYQSLAGAREALQQMDQEHYPLGKLQLLTAAHKSIVETLSSLFPSSSSADEVLPTLIYTLITCPPEGISAVSNLKFIQRFRTESKVDGEAAYCLVNLEAAISFLETVDLSSLRSNELPQGPPKSSSSSNGPATPTKEMTELSPFPGLESMQPPLSPLDVSLAEPSRGPAELNKALPSPRTPSAPTRPGMQHRRISSLVQQQADMIEAGRENILSAADKIYESINGTLDNSLQFVFGRFKDHVSGKSPLPKTLEDARKLVSKSTNAEDDEALAGSGRSTPSTEDPLNAVYGRDGKMLELLGGRKPAREHSVDSAQSGGSLGGHRGANNISSASPRPKDESPVVQAGNLFAQMNPLNRFGVPGFARFGRPATQSPPPSVPPEHVSKLSNIVESPASIKSTPDMPPIQKVRSRNDNHNDNGDDDLNAREALAELRKIKPPKKRFLKAENAGELKISEIQELLVEYKRLAKAIGEAVAT